MESDSVQEMFDKTKAKLIEEVIKSGHILPKSHKQKYIIYFATKSIYL